VFISAAEILSSTEISEKFITTREMISIWPSLLKWLIDETCLCIWFNAKQKVRGGWGGRGARQCFSEDIFARAEAPLEANHDCFAPEPPTRNPVFHQSERSCKWYLTRVLVKYREFKAERDRTKTKLV